MKNPEDGTPENREDAIFIPRLRMQYAPRLIMHTATSPHAPRSFCTAYRDPVPPHSCTRRTSERGHALPKKREQLKTTFVGTYNLHFHIYRTYLEDSL